MRTLMTHLLRLIAFGILIPFGLGVTATYAAKPKSEAAALNKVLDEIQSLKDGQTELMKELGELKKTMQPRQQTTGSPTSKTPDTLIDIRDVVAKGDPNAPAVLIEFADYECPACQHHAQNTLPQLDRDYIQTGKLRYVFMDLPLESIHPLAVKAAEAAHCAGDQGKYWEMHDRLYSAPPALGPQDLTNHAEALKLKKEDFQKCLDSDQHKARIAASVAEAARLGIQGTPGLVLGIPTADGKVQTQRMFRGAPPYPVLKQTIDGLLKPTPAVQSK